MINSTLRYFCDYTLWNAPKKIEKIQNESIKGPLSCAQKVGIGIGYGLRSIPRSVIITGIFSLAIHLLFPHNKTPASLSENLQESPLLSDTCNYLSSSTLVHLFLKTLAQSIVPATLEEMIFRFGIQNSLRQLEGSSSPFLAKFGNVKNRVLISGTLFALNHLSYSFYSRSHTFHAAVSQVIRNLLDASYSILYESFGLETSLAAHITRNSIPTFLIVTMLFIQTIYGRL